METLHQLFVMTLHIPEKKRADGDGPDKPDGRGAATVKAKKLTKAEQLERGSNIEPHVYSVIQRRNLFTRLNRYMLTASGHAGGSQGGHVPLIPCLK